MTNTISKLYQVIMTLPRSNSYDIDQIADTIQVYLTTDKNVKLVHDLLKCDPGYNQAEFYDDPEQDGMVIPVDTLNSNQLHILSNISKFLTLTKTA